MIQRQEREELLQFLEKSGVCSHSEQYDKILDIIQSKGFLGCNEESSTSDSSGSYQSFHNRLLKEAPGLTVVQLRDYYVQRDPKLWNNHPDLYALVGNGVLQQGEPLLAYDIFSTGLKTFGEHPPLDEPDSQQCRTAVNLIRGQAKALAQSDAPMQAQELLDTLIEHHFTDSETMGLLGRVYKDMAFRDETCDAGYLEKAFATYYAAYQKAMKRDDYDGAYYNGINAATLAFFGDKRNRSMTLAAEVEQLCHKIYEQMENGEKSFWLDATLGEAVLLQGDLERALTYYKSACGNAGRNILNLSTMIRQAKRIVKHAKIQTNLSPGSCVLPSVIIFSGHMADTPGREIPRFPKEKEAEISFKIKLEIDRLRAKIGYAAAAAGSDILFLEAIKESGGEIHIVLPIGIDDFREQSVSPCGHDWDRRFDEILKLADSLTILDEFNSDNFENSLEFTNTYLFGIALMRAEQIGTELHPLGVLDPNSAAGKGGTASMVRLWQSQQVEYSLITMVPPPNVNKQKFDKVPDSPPVPMPVMASSKSCGCYDRVKHHAFLPMLFADVKGYSQLTENEAICFSGSFLQQIAKVIEKHQVSILSKRTVGDGLFLVFYGLEPAIQLARDLQKMIEIHNWQKEGLPADLQMRISLDAGPCYSYTDPVMDKIEFCGNYVVRAARMEPITPPGHIYASDTFVALSRAEGLGRGSFSYAGRVILPKDYGTLSVYHVNLL